MYLIDTVVISEMRKQGKANLGVAVFFQRAVADNLPLWLSVISVGELRRGVEILRHRGDFNQAQLLEAWLATVMADYSDRLLPFDVEAAQVWGRLRVPQPENALDKPIAAIALVHDLTVVTRNVRDFKSTGVRLLNPFLPV